MSKWMPVAFMTASHLVASRFDKVTLAAIFDKDVDEKLFSARNDRMFNNFFGRTL